MSDHLHLPVDIHSPDQLGSLIAESQKYQDALRDARARAKVGKADLKPPEVSGALSGLFRSSSIDPTNSTAVEALTKQLQSTLKSAPVMHLTLAAPIGRTLRRQLTVWFRTQIHPLSLLTFAVRSDIGGGMMLQAGSHFYDFSFKGRILANKQRLMEIAGV